MVSLPTPDIVLRGRDRHGRRDRGQTRRRFVDLSTTGPAMAQRGSPRSRRSNIVQVDAPVSGGVAGAEKGTLAVMVSGPARRLDDRRSRRSK